MNALVLFDGVCNMCNGIVQFLIRHDPKGQFHFAALQSETGRQTLQRFGLGTDAMATMVLVEDAHCFTHSDAALRIAAMLGGFWGIFAVLRLIPRPWRDRAYRFVVDHRYRWFGKRDSCMVPTPELRARFLP